MCGYYKKIHDCVDKLERLYCPLMDADEYAESTFKDVLLSVFDYIDTFGEEEFTAELIDVDDSANLLIGELCITFLDLQFRDLYFGECKTLINTKELATLVFKLTADRFLDKFTPEDDRRVVSLIDEVECERRCLITKVYRILYILRVWGSEIYMAVFAKFLLQQFASTIYGKEVS